MQKVYPAVDIVSNESLCERRAIFDITNRKNILCLDNPLKSMKYPVVIHKDVNSDYGVTFPDIPGCFSFGKSIEEALAMSQEAAECHIEGILFDSEPIPVPTFIDSDKIYSIT